MKLFRINKDTKLAELTDEARTLEPFKSIIKKISPSKGDADGRKKVLNEKEVAYIYFAANHDSRLKYADKEEKLLILKKRLALPDDWKPYDLIEQGIEVVKESQITVSTPVYESAVKAGDALKKWFDHISQDITDHPERYKAKDMKDFQDNFARLGTTLDQIKSAGEKVASEHETRATNKGRMISIFETEE